MEKCIAHIIQNEYFLYKVLPNFYKDQKDSAGGG